MLDERTITPLQKLDLLNGETIYTTFRSIHELSAYFANLHTHMQNKSKLAHSHLSDTNVSYQSYDIKKTFTSTNHNIHENNTTDFQEKSNPQISDRDIVNSKQVLPSSSHQTNMSSREIASAIQELFGEIDLSHIQEDLARSLCKKITALFFLLLPE